MRRIYKALAISIASLSLLGAPAYAIVDQAALTAAISTNDSAAAVALLVNATGNDRAAIAIAIGQSTNASFLAAVLNNSSIASSQGLSDQISSAIVASLETNGSTNAVNAAFIAQIANGLSATNTIGSSALANSIANDGTVGLITAVTNAGISNGNFTNAFAAVVSVVFGGHVGPFLGGGVGNGFSTGSGQSGNNCPNGMTPDTNGSCH